MTLVKYRLEIYRESDQNEEYDKTIEMNDYQLKAMIKHIKPYELDYDGT